MTRSRTTTATSLAVALFVWCGLVALDRSTWAAGASLRSNDVKDAETTRRVRDAILHDSGLSLAAKNVTVITEQDHVTLRGSVSNETERDAVLATAQRLAGPTHVTSELVIAPR
jgi:osmotically-inducible protein OsmY